MSAPSFKRPASSQFSTPPKRSSCDKVDVTYKFRPSDWYIGVECHEKQGFNAVNPHRLAFNATMRSLTEGGAVKLISKKYDPDLYDDYKFGYGNMRSNWVRTDDPATWLVHVHGALAARLVLC